MIGRSGTSWRAGADGLEQIDRRRVGDDDFAGRSADQPRDLVADARGRLDPAMQVPALDEIAAPLVANDMREMRGRRMRQGAKRVAVEVDCAWRQDE